MKQPSREPESVPAAGKARVLVVEDDAIVGIDIRQTLRSLGYSVIGPLPSAADALQAVTEHKPDLVLMDIQTKGPIDGVQAARTLREQMRMPVIFLTAHSDPETVRRAGQTEPLGYVVKPFKAADLASVIEVALHRHAVERAMRERDHAFAQLTARLVAAIESLDGGVMVEDEAGRVQHMNEQLCLLLEQSGCNLDAIDKRSDVFDSLQRLLHEREGARLSPELLLESPTARKGTLFQLHDGRALEVRVAPTMVAGEYGGCLWTFRDVTEREQTKHALRELSLLDELTGLHNRRGLLTVCDLLYRTARREKHRVAVFFIDLDGMKPVNDQFGHDVGDQLLKRAAQVLTSTCRSSDIVARLGGDEFVVVSALDPPGEQILLARLRQALDTHNHKHPELPPVRMSIGLALDDPGKPGSVEEQLTRADAAMYIEKNAKR